MKAILQVLLRLVLSLLLSLTAVFAGFHYYGEQRLPRQPIPLTVDAARARDIEVAVQVTSTRFGIHPPTIQFNDSPIAGYTTCGSVSSDCVIHLGRFINDPFFLAHPESVIAAAIHETGHAILTARKENLSGLLPVAGMTVGFWIVLFFWFSTLRPLLLGGAAGIVAFTSLVLLPGSPLGLPAAYTVLILTATAIAVARNSLPPRARLQSFLTGLAAVVVFHAAARFNHASEYFSDMVATCEAGGIGPILRALEHLPAHEGMASYLADILFDPLHPTAVDRAAALQRLASTSSLARVCGLLRDGAPIGFVARELRW